MTRFVCTVVLSGILLATGTDTQAKPNIVFFLVDDLGWTDVGCFGSSFYETPNIDRRALLPRRHRLRGNRNQGPAQVVALN